MKLLMPWILFIASFFPISPLRALETTYWGYCQDGRAFHDEAYSHPKSEADWVCKAPTAAVTGLAAEANTQRCLLDQKENCQLDAGGSASARGAHDVPRLAWYWAPGFSEAFPDVRCECGCFSGEVPIYTSRGYVPIQSLAASASSWGGLMVAQRGQGEGLWTLSRPLFNLDFVVGPELKPLLRLETRGGRILQLTLSHPLLVLREGRWQMVRAEELEIGDHLLDAAQREDPITSLASLAPEGRPPLVYNFDTGGKSSLEHVILAGGLQVGDLHWQKRLDERKSRLENVWQAKQNTLRRM